MVFDIKNKIALITGGASGIGFNCAKELLRNGAKVSLGSQKSVKILFWINFVIQDSYLKYHYRI